MFNKSMTLKASLVALALVSTANIASACEIPDGWVEMTIKTPGETSSINRAAIRIPPDTVLMGQPFDVEFLTCGEKTAAANKITVEATMPMHNHGMNYVPEITTTSKNKYKASGMLFHMPGKWVISLETRGTDKTQRFELEIPVK